MIKNFVPKFPEKLSGTIWGITTFFNPLQHKNKKENYDVFRSSSSKQGLKLVCVELAFGDKPFELTKDDADVLVQIRGKDVMWQKERLMNIALDYLPNDCNKIIWIDCDILFENGSWVKETAKLLESYNVVQCFSQIVRLSKGVKRIPKNFKGKSGRYENQVSTGMGYYHAKGGKFGKNMPYLLPGFVFAGRRRIFDKLKFFDCHIIGSGDSFMVNAFYNEDIISFDNIPSEEFRLVMQQWRERMYGEVKGSVYYTRGKIFHLWHGNTKNRFYQIRQNIVIRENFDPNKDIRVGKSGCWEWASNKPKLHSQINQYFYLRNEANINPLKFSIFVFHVKSRGYLLVQSYLGKAGLFLNKISPKFYFFLKNNIYFLNKE